MFHVKQPRPTGHHRMKAAMRLADKLLRLRADGKVHTKAYRDASAKFAAHIGMSRA